MELAIDVRNEAASFANMGFNRYDGIPTHVSKKNGAGKSPHPILSFVFSLCL